MATVLSGQSDKGREAVFLANTTRNVQQTNAEAERLKRALNDGSIKVTCGDCGGEFAPGDLDLSCVLCETCMEVADIEIDEMDGRITAAEAEAKIAEVRAASKDESARKGGA